MKSEFISLLLHDDPSEFTDDADLYDIGSYHPVFIGETLHNRYIVLKKLEQTQYSTVWLAKDVRYNIHVCVKVFKAAPRFTEIGMQEFETLQTLYKKSKDATWLSKLQVYKRKFDLENLQYNENFCVK